MFTPEVRDALFAHEPMCDVSPLADGYNPFLLCDDCAASLLDPVDLTLWEENEYAQRRIERLFGMGTWLTRMDRRLPARVVGGVPA